jgi:mannose-1-phosphate guanylyltransferase
MQPETHHEIHSRYAVIMAGGVGSRFWPLSRAHMPKQFLDVLGTGKTLIQATIERIKELIPNERIYVVTNVQYVSIVAEQLPNIPRNNILAEPDRKNTAPCLAYAAHRIHATDPNATLLVLAADHLILEPELFRNALSSAMDFVKENNALCTLGITPLRPDTGYGYIQADQRINTGHKQLFKVKTFTEKPDEVLAQNFMDSGDFYWNSGNFVWKASDFMLAFEKWMPEEAQLFEQLKGKWGTTNEAPELAWLYSMVKNISVDYAILEKADNVYMVVCNPGWSDLGTWGSLYEELEKDSQQNSYLTPNLIPFESKGCLVHAPDAKLVVLHSVNNLIVAQSNGMLLIANRSDEQKIKQIVNELALRDPDLI